MRGTLLRLARILAWTLFFYVAAALVTAIGA